MEGALGISLVNSVERDQPTQLVGERRWGVLIRSHTCANSVENGSESCTEKMVPTPPAGVTGLGFVRPRNRCP